MKNAIIHITDRHLQDGEKFECELTTSGSFELTGNGCRINYSETDEELTNCVTTLDVEGSQKISMTRTGKYNTEMVIEKDRRHTCYYATPYGELVMGVYALGIANEINENVYKSARNIEGVKASYVGELNVYELLKYDSLVISQDAVKKLEEVYAI